MPNKFVVFNGIDQNNLASLWITDGTSTGTSELSVTGASTNGLNPTNFTQFGSEVAFEGTDASGHNGLWVTDGTSAGTSELSVSGAASGGVNPQNMAAFGGKLFFEGADTAGNLNLWVSDGTSGGTSELSIPGAATTGFHPQDMTVFGNELLLGGYDTNNHYNLWVSDGTAAGTSELQVAGTFPLGLIPQDLTPFGTKVLFNGDDQAGHNNLWVTDGTGAGTSELSVTGASANGLNPLGITVLGSKVLFEGVDASNQTGLWVSDGTAAGTSELAVANAFSGGLAPFDLTVLGNQVFFEGQDTSGQYGLWKTDGTAAGTSELSIGAPGYNTYLASNGKDVLFDGNYNLWVTDGTSAGTSELSAAGASPTLAPSFMTSVAFPISAATSTLVASPGSVTADGVSTTTLTVTVEDAHGNAVAGSAVTLLGSGTANSFGTVSGTTNANGVFTTTLASTLAQTETITATEGSVHESTSVTFNPGAPSATTSTLVASPGSVTADGVSTTTLTVTVEDAHGNLVPNAAVTLLGSGAGDVFGATSGTTNAQGVFTTTLSSTAAQAADTITATEGSVHETTSVTFNPGAPSATTSTLVASPGSVTADGVSTATLTVTVEDAHGNLVPNAAVTLSGSGTGDVFGATSGTTNAQGVFTTTLSSTTAQAADAITATEGSVHESTSVTFNPGAPSATTSTLVARPGSVTADGVSTATLTVTVEDAHGNLVPNAAVTLSSSGTGDVFGATTGTTNAQGVFTTTLSSTTAQAADTITATEGSVHESTSVTFFSKVIESSGATSLVQVGSNYFLNPVAGGTGPELESGGVPVVAGQYGSVTPIGAEQTASGYDVAWKVAGTNQFEVWSTDSSGNFVSNITGGLVSGSSSALESLETTFHQDLNGDGVIGVPTVVIESSGSTSLVQVGSNYFLNPVAGGTGPELESGGVPVVAGQYGSVTPIGAEQTASGYDVAWKVAGTNQFEVWSTDSGGNFVSNITGGLVSGSSSALESLETTFHQDLNGDGVIGVPTVVIESSGSTSLVQVGSNYFLNPVAGGTGPELESGGVPVVAGQYGSVTPIGAEQTASGYDVAWKVAGTNQFEVWSTDSGGNFVSNITGGLVSGSNSALESLETTFHQDLNGDGVIGVPTVVIESSGATSLVQVGSNYFLNPVAGGTGPELESGGVPVVAGQYGSVTPIGAEQTASGYDVAWKVAGTNQFEVWSTDSSGNFVSNITGGLVSGSSSALESLETTFHQDLNGDGVIGVPTVVIESSGSTSLVQVGSNYFLNPVAGGTGPELESGGVPVVAGQYGSVTPIGAEQTASGYDVAWKVAGTNQFEVWSTDSSGNFVSNITGGLVSGSSSALESLETTFHQDLNGDGVIGQTTIAAGATTEIPSAFSGNITFSGSTGTLQLDSSSSFSGTVAQLTGLDSLDLKGINPATVQSPTYSGNSTGGTLTVADGIHTVNVALLGNYLASTFVASSDGHGGTSVVDPIQSQQVVLAQPQHA